jgi:hypothetical protein
LSLSQDSNVFPATRSQTSCGFGAAVDVFRRVEKAGCISVDFEGERDVKLEILTNYLALPAGADQPQPLERSCQWRSVDRAAPIGIASSVL